MQVACAVATMRELVGISTMDAPTGPKRAQGHMSRHPGLPQAGTKLNSPWFLIPSKMALFTYC